MKIWTIENNNNQENKGLCPPDSNGADNVKYYSCSTFDNLLGSDVNGFMSTLQNAHSIG